MTTYPPRVKAWEISSGFGFRHNGANDSFKLNLDQLVMYETKNDEITDDDKFWDWVDEFFKKQGLKAEASVSYGRGSVPAWTGSKKEYKGKHLSSWWAEDVHSGFSWYGGTTENALAAKLALAMKAVRGVIRVVDDTVPPMVVDWASEGVSFTDFDHGLIHVNPDPVRKAKGEDAEGKAIDIATGFALHEASHSQHSRPFATQLMEPTPMRPIRVAGTLWNIVEDQRIENKTAENFPGFAPYFEVLQEWLVSESTGHLPKTWNGPLQDKINAVLAIVRFPGKARIEMKDSSFDDEFEWWTNWKNDYLSGKTGTRVTLANAIARLEMDPETKKEMDELTKQELEMEKGLSKDEITELAKKLIEEMKRRGLKGCSSTAREPKSALERALADEVSKLLEEDLVEDRPFVPRQSAHGLNPTIYITKPQEDSSSIASYVGKPNPVLQRLRAALKFRQELPQFTNRLLKSGQIDDDELWRWRTNDYRVFEERVIESRPQSQFTLLVDLSGSMRGNKLRTAQELAQLFVLALRDMDGVDMKVFGHTANVKSSTDCQVYRLWEPGDPMTRMGLINTLPHMNNYDGYAIDSCLKEILNRGMESEQRVIVVLSDGWPSGSGYGGTEGENHVRWVTNWGEKHGVQVIQVAIDPDMDATRQARMFRNWVAYTTTEELPRKMERLLDRLTS